MYNRVKVKTYSRKNSSYLKKAFVASNFNEMCRLCLSELDKSLTPIIRNSDNMSYQEWIEYSVDIKVQEGDGLPPNICTECLQLVEQTYLFKKKCRTSDSKLREHLELIEQSDENRLRHSLVQFSDLEDELNLFRRNESTQNTGEQNNLSDSGGTALDTHTIANPGDINIIETLDDEDDDAVGDDDCTYKDVNNTPKEKKQSNVLHSISNNKTKDLEQQTVSIPKQNEKRKKGEVKNKGYQSEEKSKENEGEIKSQKHEGEIRSQEHEGEIKSQEHEGEIKSKEPEGKITSKENEGDDSKVQKFISNGENRTDDNDDELEQIFLIFSDEKNDDTIIIPEISDKDSMKENDSSFRTSQAEKSEATVQAIYEQWACAEAQQAAETQNTSGDLNSSIGYNNNNRLVTDDRHNFESSHADETRGPPGQNLTTGQDKMTQASAQRIAMQQPRRYPCESDPFQINRIYRTRNQIKIIETVPSEARYSCCMCPQTYPTLPELKEHLVSAHHISESSSCEICFKTFTCVNSLRRHMLIHAGFKPYKCRICGRGFSQISILKRHVFTHEASRPFVCEKCQKGYTQKMSLEAHMKTHSMMRSSCMFTCQSCKKSFAHQSGLSRHLKEHRGFRFMCDDCMKSFADPSALTRHVKRLHPNTNPEPVMNVRPSTAT